jgi:hypothetical protein
MYSKILAQIKTDKDKELLLEELDVLKTGLYDLKDGFEKALSKVRQGTADLMREALVNAAVDKTQFLEGLETELEKVRTLKLTLAFEPSEEFVSQLYQWTLSNIQPGIILDFEKDKSLLGGVVIEYEGLYKDYSLRKVLENAGL